ncbi:sortase-associated OmpA-like protein PdsO [uncultured Paraglaciecola sp.]|uniref:sortase-associated OmpA-like protein PdsO n=1 Tax=uncultured Paraglaciecola sp. TaxID=1765024 RepID=UPI0026236CE8|nr:sortase-associated OmpA-like protein PdsO [uncultured Paraglaciecola sp.]
MNINKHKFTTSIAFTCLLSSSALAEPNKQQEKTNELIGFSSGAIIGTAIGGPFGGVIAAIFGGMVANDINSDNKLEKASQSLQQKEQQLVVLQQDIEAQKQQALAQIASMDNALEQARLLQNTSEIQANIQFKTASYVLEQHYKSQLDLLAQRLQQNPKLTITLSGFADQRGDSSFNQVLSEQRALSVRSYLISKGVKKEQVITYSFGESELVSAGVNFEDDFFDRRVMLKVSNKQSAMTAANQ